MTPVVRVGDTVRRAAGPWTPAVHALLRHLRARGFRQAPEPLGLDRQGREILTLLPGRVATYPLPAFVWSDDTLVAVARLLAAYHQATAGFVPPAGAVWQWPAHQPAEVLCHNDFAPYNLLFEDGRPCGVIDFDTASPGQGFGTSPSRPTGSCRSSTRPVLTRPTPALTGRPAG
jgi:Ser/Thr protein kinase RdoA (MazF antagonist)